MAILKTITVKIKVDYSLLTILKLKLVGFRVGRLKGKITIDELIAKDREKLLDKNEKRV